MRLDSMVGIATCAMLCPHSLDDIFLYCCSCRPSMVQPAAASAAASISSPSTTAITVTTAATDAAASEDAGLTSRGSIDGTASHLTAYMLPVQSEECGLAPGLERSLSLLMVCREGSNRTRGVHFGEAMGPLQGPLLPDLPQVSLHHFHHHYRI